MAGIAPDAIGDKTGRESGQGMILGAVQLTDYCFDCLAYDYPTVFVLTNCYF